MNRELIVCIQSFKNLTAYGGRVKVFETLKP